MYLFDTGFLDNLIIMLMATVLSKLADNTESIHEYEREGGLITDL